jgi:hypothetical protein
MRGDIEGTQTRLQPKAVVISVGYLKFGAPAFADCSLAGCQMPRLASIWPMASTTASKVSSVEACRAL